MTEELEDALPEKYKPLNYKNAVSWIKEYLVTNHGDLPLSKAYELRRVFDRSVDFRVLMKRESELADFLKQAEVDYEKHMVVRTGIAALVEQRAELPDPLRNWLYRFLVGWSEPPKRRKGPQSIPSYKNHLICYLVHMLVKEGMPAGQNDEPATRKDESACHAVAQALRESEIGSSVTSYSTVKDIWDDERHKHLFTYLVKK